MGKASLALAFAIIVAVVSAATGGRQAVAQITTATVDQYLTQAGEAASTTSRSFRESRSEGPETQDTPDTSSGTSGNASNAPGTSRTLRRVGPPETPPQPCLTHLQTGRVTG